jgi:phosphoglycolate phosphatase-like HAD superfamily hydrolase
MTSLDASRIRAILFDIDGTLADTDDHAVRLAAGLLARMHVTSAGRSSGALARRLIMAGEGPLNALITLLDRLMLDELLAPVLEAFNRRRPAGRGPKPALIPGIEELVATLATRFPLGIVTTRGNARTHRFLVDSRLEHSFRSVVTARSTQRTKPHPEPVVRAAQELGVTPEECVIVGDTTVDIRAGRAAGAQTIGVLCGFGEREELERAGADLILSTTADLASVLLDV